MAPGNYDDRRQGNTDHHHTPNLTIASGKQCTGGEGSNNEPISSATDQTPHPTVAGAGHTSLHPHAGERTAACGLAEMPSTTWDAGGHGPLSTLKRNNKGPQRRESKGHDKREQPPVDRRQGRHRATSEHAHSPYRIGGGTPRANSTSEIEQEAKKQRLEAHGQPADHETSWGEIGRRCTTPIQLPPPGRHRWRDHANDSRISGAKLQSSCTGQKPAESVCKPSTPSHPSACRVEAVPAYDTDAGKHGRPPDRAIRTSSQAAVPRSTNGADTQSAHRREVAGHPKRERGATHLTYKADKNALHIGRARKMPGKQALPARPRTDAGGVKLCPSKKRGAHVRHDTVGPSPAGVGSDHHGHPARPAGGAAEGPHKKPRQRGASSGRTMPTQARKARRLSALSRPVPDARLTGRGWHDRWPPPALGSGGTVRGTVL